MNYLELVNAVLIRLREDEVTSVDGVDDPVVQLAKEFINDAKHQVEQAHAWTALSEEWEFSTVPSNNKVVLTNSSNSVIIDYIYDSNGVKLPQASKEYIRSQSAALGNATNDPRYFCLDGAEPNGDHRLMLYPTPKKASTFVVYGYQSQPRLKDDADVMAVPALPVIYIASAMAARERGEVGAQSPNELIAIAKQYLQDAIAQDATNSDLENIWTMV